MSNRNYSSVARAVTLTAPLSGSATTMPVSETTGFPSVPFTLVVDPGRTGEEVITVTGQVGLTLTVQRGQDGTTAVPHDPGATLRHMATARDFREPAEHIALTNGVHGVVGNVVGDIDDQTLDNKTFVAQGTDHTPISIKSSGSQTAPLMVFQEPGGTPVVSYSYIGSAGILETGSKTIQAASPGLTPLTVKGASGQSADLMRASDSSGAILSRIDGTGKFNGAVAGDLTATNATVTNLTATNATLSGIVAAGQVPFKMRAGSVAVTIAVGDSATLVTADISSSGFTQAPFVTAIVSTNENTGDTRRVSVERLPPTNNTQIQFRIFQTAGVALSVLGNYSIQYIAVQMSSSSAAG